MLHKKYVNRGFTLVELLAVIVILAIILVIAVPKIMSVITDSKKASLETSAKMIASSAEKIKVQKELLGQNITGEADCSEFTKVTSDYASCTVKFDGNTAKVNITGANKFEGLSICNAEKNNATATNSKDGCPKEKYSIAGKEWPEIIATVKSGEYEFIVGETKEVDLGDLGTHTLRIANTTPCSEAFPDGTADKSETACGFVLEFSDIITTHVMNSTSTSEGGWPASEMRSYLNNEETGIYNSLPNEFKNAIIGTKVISGHGSEDSNNFITEDVKLYLLSGEEIYEGFGSSDDASVGTSRQLDYYYEQRVSTSDYSGAIKKLSEPSWWWLRSAYFYNDCTFYYVIDDGDLGGKKFAANAGGVSPAFRLV